MDQEKGEVPVDIVEGDGGDSAEPSEAPSAHTPTTGTKEATAILFKQFQGNT